MSENYQRVEPTPFNAQQTGQPEQAPGAARDRSGWLLPGLAALLLLAVAVVFLLPKLVDNRASSDSVPSASTGLSSSTGAQPAARPDSTPAAGNDTSPFADAVEAKARAAAQELLAELLDVQDNLRLRGAESWAPESMAAVAGEALAGDERYRERDFDAAIGHYNRALEQAVALEGSLGERFEFQLGETEAAIEALDSATARASLELARLLEPDNVMDLEARVASIGAIGAAMEAAAAAAAANDLATAVSELEAAAELDRQHLRVASELQRLRVARTEQRFNAAMSEGYAALDTGTFDRARARFEGAAKLKPGSAEAAAALQELSVAQTAARLQTLQRRADTLLAGEDWDTAIDVFEEALSVDAGLRFAREGLEIARPRAALDKELGAILEQPGRLVDDAILNEARDALQRALALNKPGPRFREQIAAVEETLAVASRPITVNLGSDGATEVTVYKVARLGLFEARQLSLRPGQYTAVGRRRGYRDVRVVFTVAPQGIEPVYIACSETI